MCLASVPAQALPPRKGAELLQQERAKGRWEGCSFCIHGAWGEFLG